MNKYMIYDIWYIHIYIYCMIYASLLGKGCTGCKGWRCWKFRNFCHWGEHSTVCYFFRFYPWVLILRGCTVYLLPLTLMVVDLLNWNKQTSLRRDRFSVMEKDDQDVVYLPKTPLKIPSDGEVHGFTLFHHLFLFAIFGSFSKQPCSTPQGAIFWTCLSSPGPKPRPGVNLVLTSFQGPCNGQRNVRSLELQEMALLY